MPDRKYALKILNECIKNLNAPKEKSSWMNFGTFNTMEYELVKKKKKKKKKKNEEDLHQLL